MNFNYYIPTRILFGKGSLNQLSVQQLPGKKALVVISAGKSMKQNGYLDRVLDQLHQAHVETVVFDKILPNPVLEHINQGGQLAKETGCDFVVGLGGGSSIDSAKAIAIMATNSGDYWDYIHGGSGKGLEIPNRPLPVVAITTTAGTGTEADPWTVITKTQTGEKIGGGYDLTYPVLSIVDPELMVSVPATLTAYQGFDALFHSTEGYLNKTNYVLSDMYALEAIRRLGSSLAIAVKHGDDLVARENVALGNTLAGMVESTSGCISEHSIEHAMSGFHPNLPHGAGLIMISYAYYEKLIEKGVRLERFVDMAKALGYPAAEKPTDFLIALRKLQEDCGVADLKMSDYGITRDEISKITKSARDTMGGLFEVDPITVSDQDVIDILNRAYR